jgi:4-hydroxy-tetrahydrodipicolinate reductase
MTTKVAIVGATGKMGQLAARIVDETEGFEVVARLASKDPIDALLGSDVVIDVTVPAVSPGIVDFAVQHGLNVLVGTSGWTADRIARLERTLVAQPDVGVIIVPNFSIGSVLATTFAATAARYFDSMEIIEAHHASKVDSPSGTAIRTAELMGKARADLGPVAAPHTDQRARGQQVSSIPVHSMRMHGVVARQEVVFGGDGEILRLIHETMDPRSYEAGIRMSLLALADARGVIVGLDAVLASASAGAAAAPAS